MNNPQRNTWSKTKKWIYESHEMNKEQWSEADKQYKEDLTNLKLLAELIEHGDWYPDKKFSEFLESETVKRTKDSQMQGKWREGS